MLPSEITGASAASTASSASRTDPTDLGREDFLRMLVAQLENQDPLNPQDGTQFTAQLAQFSSLEQLIAMRSSIDALASAESDRRVSAESLAAAGLIGRDVLAATDAFEVSREGVPPRLEVDLESAATAVDVRILDANGNRVRTLRLDATPAGRSELAWDGLDDQGFPVEPGLYRLEVSASADLTPVTATSLLSARVTGTDLSGAEPELRLGAVTVPLASLREVREAAEEVR